MNPKAAVTFRILHQDFQEYGSTDDHMVSRVFFDVTHAGQTFKNAYCEIKQPAGGDFRTDPMEVGLPANYNGPSLNYQHLRERVESYYRAQISTGGSAIRLPDQGRVRMRNNTVITSESADIEIGDPSTPAW